jgi:hypothetical protein
VPTLRVPGPAPQPRGCPPVDSRHREGCPRHECLRHPCGDERSCQEKRRRRELPMCRKDLLQFERGSHMVCFLFANVKHGLYKVCLWFAFCFHMSSTVCMQFAYGLLTIYKKLTPPTERSSHLLIRCGRVVPERSQLASRRTGSSQGRQFLHAAQRLQPLQGSLLFHAALRPRPLQGRRQNHAYRRHRSKISLCLHRQPWPYRKLGTGGSWCSSPPSKGWAPSQPSCWQTPG